MIKPKPEIKIWVCLICLILIIIAMLTISGISIFNKINNKASDIEYYTKSGTVIYLYKDNCSDCKAIETDVKQYLENKTDTYMLSTDTQIGHDICEKYSITQVPTIIYIKHNQLKSKIYQAQANTTDANNNTIINKFRFDRAFQLQAQND